MSGFKKVEVDVMFDRNLHPSHRTIFTFDDRPTHTKTWNCEQMHQALELSAIFCEAFRIAKETVYQMNTKLSDYNYKQIYNKVELDKIFAEGYEIGKEMATKEQP
jgi:hypothetical protein